MTVRELMLRLLQLPQDAIVGHEEEELLVIDPTGDRDRLYVVASKYYPETESFGADHLIVKEK